MSIFLDKIQKEEKGTKKEKETKAYLRPENKETKDGKKKQGR